MDVGGYFAKNSRVAMTIVALVSVFLALMSLAIKGPPRFNEFFVPCMLLPSVLYH